MFAGFLNRISTLFNQVSLGNFTILAPSDDAFMEYFKSQASVENDTEAFGALLSYHVLQGAHARAGFQVSPLFIPTLLTNPNYANVTGGQRVEVISSGNNVYFVSAVKARSKLDTSDIVYIGTNGAGIVHIIDTVLTIPIDLPSTATQAGMHEYIQIGSLSQPDPQILGALGPSSDWTIFGANSSSIPINSLSLQNLYAYEAYQFLHRTVAYSTDLKNGLKLQTVLGEDVTITLQNGTVYVNAAKIIESDYLISTGVLHLVDVAMNPNDTSARPSSLPSISTPAVISSSTASAAGFSADAKAGIGIGAGIGAVAVLVLLWWCMRMCKRMCKPYESRAELANHTVLPVELGSGEKGLTAELYGRPRMQVYEIGVNSGEGGMAAESYERPLTQDYEIGVAL